MEAAWQTSLRNEHMDQQISKNIPKFEIGGLVMVKNHAHCTFEPKYLMDYRVLKILSDSTLLLVALNGKEKKQILMMSNLAVHKS